MSRWYKHYIHNNLLRKADEWCKRRVLAKITDVCLMDNLYKCFHKSAVIIRRITREVYWPFTVLATRDNTLTRLHEIDREEHL